MAMIPYEELVAGLQQWRATQGLATGPADFLGTRTFDIGVPLATEANEAQGFSVGDSTSEIDASDLEVLDEERADVAPLQDAAYDADAAYGEAAPAFDADAAYDEAPVAFDDAAPDLDDAPPAFDEAGPAFDDAAPALDDAPPAFDDAAPALDDAPAAFDDAPVAFDDAPPDLDDAPPDLDDAPPAFDDAPLAFDDAPPDLDDALPDGLPTSQVGEFDDAPTAYADAPGEDVASGSVEGGFDAHAEDVPEHHDAAGHDEEATAIASDPSVLPAMDGPLPLEALAHESDDLPPPPSGTLEDVGTLDVEDEAVLGEADDEATRVSFDDSPSMAPPPLAPPPDDEPGS